MSTAPDSLDPISLNHDCSAVFPNLPVLERYSRGLHTKMCFHKNGGGEKKRHKGTPKHIQTSPCDHDPLRVPGALKASSSNSAVGVTLLFQLLESAKEDRKVCLTKLPILGKIIEKKKATY